MIPTKVCNRCKLQKSTGEFYRRGKSRSGFREVCKACWHLKAKDYHVSYAPKGTELARVRKRRLTSDGSSRAVVFGPLVCVRFWSLVDAKDRDECWEWVAARDKKGYGLFRSLSQGAHRIAYELHHGIKLPVHKTVTPTTPLVLHRCDNPPCCNPFHLWLGTSSDNAKDRNKKGRQRGGYAWKAAVARELDWKSQ